MYRIIDGRGSGKTSRLMLLAKEHNGVLVCANPYAMREKAYSYGLVGFDIISYSEFIDNTYKNEKPIFNRDEKDKPIFIDELDVFLKNYHSDIMGYTVSEDD